MYQRFVVLGLWLAKPTVEPRLTKVFMAIMNERVQRLNGSDRFGDRERQF